MNFTSNKFIYSLFVFPLLSVSETVFLWGKVKFEIYSISSLSTSYNVKKIDVHEMNSISQENTGNTNGYQNEWKFTKKIFCFFLISKRMNFKVKQSFLLFKREFVKKNLFVHILYYICYLIMIKNFFFDWLWSSFNWFQWKLIKIQYFHVSCEIFIFITLEARENVSKIQGWKSSKIFDTFM